MNNFNPKLIIITGVTQGLGEAMLKEFYKLGFIVIGCGRNLKKLAQLSKKYLKGEFSSMDISSRLSVQKWIKKTVRKYGVPKLIINNASIIDDPPQVFENANIVDLTNIINVNLFGTMYVTYYFLPYLKQYPRQTTIINISSEWGRNAETGLAGYCASKFGVEGFTGVIAKENRGVVTAVSLDPRGGIATNMLAKCTDKSYYNTCPNPNEWAKVAVPYMLSISPKQTGRCLTVPEINRHKR